MSLTDEFSSLGTQEQIQKFGKNLLRQYGPEVCEAASVLDEQNISESTAGSYKSQVRQVLSHCEDMNPTPRDVADFISDQDKKSSSKSLMVSSMESYYSAIGHPDRGEELRQISNKRGLTEKNFSTEQSISGWITKEEVDRIQKHLLPDEGETIKRVEFPDKTHVFGIEHKALAMTLYYTACRVGEICRQDSDDKALRVEDVYEDKCEVKVYRLKKAGKGYKRDMIAVPQELIDILTEYLEYKDITEGQIFPFTTRTAQNRIRDINKAYKHAYGGFQHMEDLTPHKFRHGRITDLANNSSLEKAGDYVDHESPETTNQYRHIATEEQRDILPENNDSSNEDKAIKKIMEKLDVDDVDEALEIIDSIK